MAKMKKHGKVRQTTFPEWDDLTSSQRFFLRYFKVWYSKGDRIDPWEYWHSSAGESELARLIEENPGKRPRAWWTINRGRVHEPFKRLGRVKSVRPHGPCERRESEAAYLARHGELTPSELTMWEAGELPTEELTYPAVGDPTQCVGPVNDE